MFERRQIWILLVLAILFAGCRTSAPLHSPKAAPTKSLSEGQGGGLQFTLSEGKEPTSDQSADQDKRSPATVEPLNDDQVRAVLSGLPAFTAKPQIETFAIRESSRPVPRTGDTVLTPFPPPPTVAKPPTVASVPLEILRHTPEGDVPVAPQLSVTFNQPMVALASPADLAESDPPVTLSPQPPGTWRWIGTSTVLFDPSGLADPQGRDRFPMATEFKAEVAKGVRSADGAALAKGLNWTFRTPTVTLLESSPGEGPQSLDPLIWTKFDQDIETDEVFPSIRIEGVGAPAVGLRLATADEMTAAGRDPGASRREVAFKAVRLLKPGTTYTVWVGPGTPSAEGPLTTVKAQSFSFSTHDILKVTDHGCNYGSPLLTPLHVTFNNPIDPEQFVPAMVDVSPPIEDLSVRVSGDTLWIEGQMKGRTVYTVSLAPKIPDVFRQTLGKSKPIKFSCGPAEPRLEVPGGSLVSLDPNDPTSYSVYVTNIPKIRVRIYSVQPSDWTEFQKRLLEETEKAPFVAPGQLLSDSVIETHAKPDEMTEVPIDVKPALPKGKGMAVVVIQRPEAKSGGWDHDSDVRWIQATDIGMDAAVDNSSMQLLVTSLSTGRAVSGVGLRMLNAKNETLAQTQTGAKGEASMALPDRSSKFLLATKGDDASILPEDDSYYSQGGWKKATLKDQLRWYVADDRAMYRPDEKVSVKGWVRRQTFGPRGDIANLQGKLKTLTWALRDGRGTEVLKGKVPVSPEGSFHLQLTLPKSINLGTATLSFKANVTLEDSEFFHRFQVQEFRRPEFEVSAQSDPESAVVGESATTTVDAKYFAGGGLPNAPVKWTVTTASGTYTPPGHDDFSFGAWKPFWSSHFNSYDQWNDEQASPVRESLSGHTDASGHHYLDLHFLSIDEPQPTVVRAEASVSDVNRQEWSADTSILVHPSDYYVGLRTAKTFIEKGDPLKVEVLVCHRDGTVLDNVPVELSVLRQGDTAAHLERTVTSALDPSTVVFQLKQGGTYSVKARVIDQKGRANESSLTTWVSGAEAPPTTSLEQGRVTLIPSKKEYRVGETAEVLVQSPFAPAEGILTWRRSGIVKTERISLKDASTTIKVPISETDLPNLGVQVDLVGAVTMSSGQSRPAYATGSVNLSIPPLTRTLTVQVQSASPSADPGSKTSLGVTVTDAQGRPVPNAEVTLFAVDEALLALSGYQIPDPLGVFYPQREPGVEDHHSREYLVLNKETENESRLDRRVKNLEDISFYGEIRPFDTRGRNDGGGPRGTGYTNYNTLVGTLGGGALGRYPAYNGIPGLIDRYDDSYGFDLTGTGYTARGLLGANIRVADDIDAGAEFSAYSSVKGRRPGPIKMRTDFNPTALFAPLVKTDAKGQVTVPFQLPDNLTRYRLIALATDGAKQFGKGESALTARLPLMVRPSAPRFLNFGDAFELPVVLQNQTDKPMSVRVAARTVNLKLSKDKGYQLTIPANDRVEVRFPATTDRAGKAHLQVGAVGLDGVADAAEISLPVWTPATTEAFASYGEIPSGTGDAKIDSAVAQTVKPPSDVYPQYGGLEVTASSSALSSLTDAFVYLVSYPFDGSEQIASRLLGVAALRDVLWAFKAKGLPDSAALKTQVQGDLKRLEQLQLSNGGFALWGGDQTWPYVTVHVAHALARAKEKGYTVPDQMLERSKIYLANVDAYIPGRYSKACQQSIQAYALYVRHRLGVTDQAKILALVKEAGGVTKLPLEAMGWLYYVICKDQTMAATTAEIRKHLTNTISETAGNAHFVTSYSEESGYLVMATDRRVNGILLEALIQDQPNNDLIPKLAKGLLAHRSQGQWGSTQDNAFVLLALDLYFQTYEKTTPDFVARTWLGDDFAGEQAFRGRQIDSQTLTIPMSHLVAKGEEVLTLAKDGPGRLYYRLAMSYASEKTKIDPADNGFTVQRRYEGVDAPDDVWQDKGGTWRIRAGAKVRVTLTMAASTYRYHVALVDQIPAGLEPINPALAVSASEDSGGQASEDDSWWWSGTWYEHQNMRDERVEAFTSRLWAGVHEYVYLARATTPGDFVVPPTKAEEMYAPETFGRSSSDRVIVE